MSDLLIAVGGTGQHVALAVSRLIRMGALRPMDAIVIDADAAGGVSQQLSTFGGSLKIEGVSEPLPHPLHGAERIHPPFDLQTNANADFESLVLGNGANPRHRQLFELFFTPPEAKTNVAQGMYGQPNVGSTVFAIAASHSASADAAPRMRVLLEGTRSANNIYVTGSFIGGTGAGLVHQLVRQLREIHGKDKKIYGLFLLPWLATQSTAAGTINVAGLDTNFRHGCTYLWDETRHHLTGTLILGVPSQVSLRYVRTVQVDSNKDEETPSFLHLVAAFGVLGLENSVVKDGKGHVFGAGHSTEHEDALITATPWAGDVTLVQRTHAMMTVDRLLAALFDEMGDIKSGFSLLGARHIEGFHEGIKNHASAAQMKETAFIDLVWRYLEIHRRQHAFCLRWLGSLASLPPLPATNEAMWKDRASVLATLRKPDKLRREFPAPPQERTGRRLTNEELARTFADSVVRALQS